MTSFELLALVIACANLSARSTRVAETAAGSLAGSVEGRGSAAGTPPAAAANERPGVTSLAGAAGAGALGTVD